MVAIKVGAFRELEELWHSSEVPLPFKLLEELQQGNFFWTAYLEDWLHELLSDSEYLPPGQGVSQGRIHKGWAWVDRGSKDLLSRLESSDCHCTAMPYEFGCVLAKRVVEFLILRVGRLSG